MTPYSAPGILIRKDPFKAIADIYQVDKNDIASMKRHKELVYARAILYNHFKTKHNFTLMKIGDMVGGRDHVTVLNGLRTYRNMYDTDEVFKRNAMLFDEVV